MDSSFHLLFFFMNGRAVVQQNMSAAVTMASNRTPNRTSGLPPFHEPFMQAAFDEARVALADGECPVGCVVVRYDVVGDADVTTATKHVWHKEAAEEMSTLPNRLAGSIVARGHNLTNSRSNALEHAEFVAFDDFDKAAEEALREASSSPGGTDDASCGPYHVLYVTVEPCIMCAAMLRLRGDVSAVYFGCSNPRFGGNGGVLSLHTSRPRRASDDPTDTAAAADMAQRSHTADGIRCYVSQGGFMAVDAVQLLKDFYEQENPLAPDPKRRVKAAPFDT